MRGFWVIVMAAFGCQGSTAAPSTGRIEYVAPARCDFAPQQRQAELAARLDQATSIRAQLKTDPVGALQDLGMRIDEFEPIAKALYYKWLEEHPEARKPAPAPAPAPRPLVEPFGASQRWWCFVVGDWEWGDCSTTSADCKATRAAYVASRSSSPCALTQAECTDIAAGVMRIGSCERQQRASCFSRYHVLRDQSELACAPSIAICKDRRAKVMKGMSDDLKIQSECKVTD